MKGQFGEPWALRHTASGQNVLRNRMNERIEDSNEMLARAHECVSACTGIPDPVDAVERARRSLMTARSFILDEYGLFNMEAHHDGIPVSKEARGVWNCIHDALAALGDGHE